MCPVAVRTNESKKGKRAPHAGINSGDEIYKALAEQIEKAGHGDIVRVLGRGDGSNTVRFACAVCAEVLASGHRVVLEDSTLTVVEPAPPETASTKPAGKKKGK